MSSLCWCDVIWRGGSEWTDSTVSWSTSATVCCSYTNSISFSPTKSVCVWMWYWGCCIVDVEWNRCGFTAEISNAQGKCQQWLTVRPITHSLSLSRCPCQGEQWAFCPSLLMLVLDTSTLCWAFLTSHSHNDCKWHTIWLRSVHFHTRKHYCPIHLAAECNSSPLHPFWLTHCIWRLASRWSNRE